MVLRFSMYIHLSSLFYSTDKLSQAAAEVVNYLYKIEWIPHVFCFWHFFISVLWESRILGQLYLCWLAHPGTIGLTVTHIYIYKWLFDHLPKIVGTDIFTICHVYIYIYSYIVCVCVKWFWWKMWWTYLKKKKTLRIFFFFKKKNFLGSCHLTWFLPLWRRYVKALLNSNLC